MMKIAGVSLGYHLMILLFLSFGYVKGSGFDLGFGEDEDDDEEVEDGPPEIGEMQAEKRNPIEGADTRYSPQLSLEDRVKSSANKFTETLPPGELKFGDAILSADQSKRLMKKHVIGEAAINDDKLRWSDAVIPYEIDCSLTRLVDAISAIKDGMKQWEDKTCIKFVERRKQKMFLRFFRDTHCWGNVGMHKNSTVSVGYGCEQANVMAHEIGHAIGFYHEQNRKDRDKHITVNMASVGKFANAFEKVQNVYSLGESYDIGSIMHYPWSAFSSDGRDTMSPIKRPAPTPYKEISDSDARQVSAMYNCKEVTRKRQQAISAIQAIIDDIPPRPRPAVGELMTIDDDERELRSEMYSAPGDAGCVDWSDNCKDWARVGYCDTEAVVKKYCKKTCNIQPICAGEGSKNVRQENCPTEDKQPQTSCEGWSKFCGNNAYKAYMKENCCNVCERKKKKKEVCKDTRTFCSDYARQGYCKSSENMRTTYCCKTCKASLKTERVDGSWGDWPAYGTCSKTCGGGERVKIRACNNPSPINGGLNCKLKDGSTGTTEQEREGCNLSPCPVIGSWGGWSGYADCSKTCGGGQRWRYRYCNEQQRCASTGGAQSSKEEQSEGCNTNACPVNGKWGAWSQFDTCTATCGGGRQFRFRTCNNPSPSNGGIYCLYSDEKERGKSEKQARICNAGDCPAPKPKPREKQSGSTTCRQSSKSTIKPVYPTEKTYLGIGTLCTDMSPKCTGWAEGGWCTRNPGYMNKYCKRACKVTSCDEPGKHPDDVCSKPLGLSDRSKITDSAFWSSHYHMVAGSGKNVWSAGPANARLYFEDDFRGKNIGAWCAQNKEISATDLVSISVDLGKKKRISYIATQGRDKYFERVSKFKIAYSDTGNDKDFCPYMENGEEKIFDGNCDHVTPVVNRFSEPLEARYIRFIPWRYNYPCVRMELYGCELSDVQPSP